MRPWLLLRLALAGTRTDRLRVVLTAVTAALATGMLLGAATLLPTGSLDHRYQVILFDYSDGRQATAFLLLVVCVPVLALAAQAGRIGAPARHRRLAALRLAGATPRQVTAVAAAETGAAAALGAGIGLVAFLLGQELLHQRDPNGRLWLPTDVRPSPLLLALILIGLPAASALIAAVLLRNLHNSPLGEVRSAGHAAPKPWPLLLIPCGPAAYVVLRIADGRLPWPVLMLLLLGGGLAAAGGLVLGMAWLSDRAGRLLHRHARGPAALLAARRLTADPWSGSRTIGVLVVCALAAGATLGLRAYYATQMDVLRRYGETVNPLTGGVFHEGSATAQVYLSALNLLNLAIPVAAAIAAAGVLITLLEAVSARRRAFASLTAGGVRRRVLVRALLWQALLPVSVAMPAAVLLGAIMLRLIFFDIEAAERLRPPCEYGSACAAIPEHGPAHEVFWLADWAEVAAVSAGGLALVALVALGAAVTLRVRTDLQSLRTT
ncbi:FtsX-like permease family protein [Catellatospora sichuanensis]|uniref:FtsX-like permease family protein n=1 Tax=Catellatospora sichuanensis TaxID=1969805 RepID=UPI0011842A78|nr:FtsX-like permease family protein [Catellatospora sichuanensis]